VAGVLLGYVVTLATPGPMPVLNPHRLGFFERGVGFETLPGSTASGWHRVAAGLCALLSFVVFFNVTTSTWTVSRSLSALGMMLMKIASGWRPSWPLSKLPLLSGE
jgi:hypothetical protein